MKRLAPPDAVAFLVMESASCPSTMGALQVFTPPEGAGPDFVRDTHEAMRVRTDVAPMFRGHPQPARRGSLPMLWTYDDDLDLDYHLPFTRLPAPGGKQELSEFVACVHGRLHDRRKPLWQVHVIDGLSGGRFALLYKVHHALFDGFSYLSFLRRSLSSHPHDTQVRAMWTLRPETRSGSGKPRARWRDRPIKAVKSLGELAPSVSLIRAALRERDLFPTFRAEPTIFNASGDLPWRCSMQSWPLDRLKAVRSAAGVTVNDVILALWAGALRSLLLERNALPRLPLTSIVPVNLRNDHDVEGRSVASSAVCSLATHLEDPLERLNAVHASMLYNKELLRGLPRQVSMYLAGVIAAPFGDAFGLGGVLPTQFNLAISHVVDAREPRYHNGGRLEGTYVFPPTMRRHALTVGVVTDANNVNFALVTTARVLPDHDRLWGNVDASLKELERAVGL